MLCQVLVEPLVAVDALGTLLHHPHRIRVHKLLVDAAPWLLDARFCSVFVLVHVEHDGVRLVGALGARAERLVVFGNRRLLELPFAAPDLLLAQAEAMVLLFTPRAFWAPKTFARRGGGHEFQEERGAALGVRLALLNAVEFRVLVRVVAARFARAKRVEVGDDVLAFDALLLHLALELPVFAEVHVLSRCARAALEVRGFGPFGKDTLPLATLAQRLACAVLVRFGRRCLPLPLRAHGVRRANSVNSGGAVFCLIFGARVAVRVVRAPARQAALGPIDAVRVAVGRLGK